MVKELIAAYCCLLLIADAPFKQVITGVAKEVIAAYSAFDCLKEIEY